MPLPTGTPAPATDTAAQDPIDALGDEFAPAAGAPTPTQAPATTSPTPAAPVADEEPGLLETLDPEEVVEDPQAAPAPATLTDETVLWEDDGEGGVKTPITLAEAKRRGLRQKDYTQKTMAVAEEKRQAEAMKAEYSKLVDAYRNHLGQFKEPNWEQLKQTDPNAYLLARDEWNQLQAERQAADTEATRLAGERQAQAQKDLQAAMQQEQEKLLAALPHWKDPQVAAREVKLIQEHLIGRGFDAAFMAKLTAQEALLIRDAALYHQLKSKAKPKQVTPKAGKPLRAGAPSTQTPKSPTAARFEQSGALKDAGDVFADELFGS